MTIEKIEKEWEALFSVKEDKGFDLCRGIDWMQVYGPKLLAVAKAAKEQVNNNFEETMDILVDSLNKLEEE